MNISATQWFDGARIYHTMVDRFNGGWQTPPVSVNDFCGGDLRGVMEKLGYIQKFGFNTIMLTPFLKTAGYHGYHTISYDEVDPHFGTWEDFQELLDKAHAMGIRVVCDFVPNHCSYWNPIFQAALLSNGGQHRDWFFFPKEGSDEYVSFLNLPDLPKFNLENPEAANYMASKAERLAKMGVDGFRIDHALGQPFSFLKYLRQALKNIREDIVVFGEVWAEGISKDLYNQLYFKESGFCDEESSLFNTIRKMMTSMLGKEHEEKVMALNQEHLQADYADVLDGVLDFSFRAIIIEEIQAGHRIKGNQTLRDKVSRHFKCYPFDFKLVLFLDNHDTDRFLYVCNNDVTLLEEAIEFMRELNRPFSLLYGTEQLMTTSSSIFGAEPYADLRVRQCMDWTQTPVNQNNYLPSNSDNKMPIVNGTSWTADSKLSADVQKGKIQPRRMSENGKVVWYCTNPTWDIPSLILQQSVKKQLEEISAFITNKEKYIDLWGIRRFQRGGLCICINFLGASGCGKSISAEAIASTSGLKVIKASYSQIQSDRWGGTENNLTSLFEEAKKTRSVIILNEADGLFSKRRSDGANSDTNNQIKCHLLNLMDTYEVILILTTNRFEDYDEAFYRRTMFQVEFSLPGYEELVQLWKMHLGCSDEERFSKEGEIPKTAGFSFENVAYYSEGLFGGDIRRITLGVMAKLLTMDAPVLTEEIVNKAIDDYKKIKMKMKVASDLRPVMGKRKEEYLSVINQ
jgi:glycosidase